VAEVQPRQHVLDPFCGAGTIPIEAALHGALAWGGDLDPTALLAAGENAKSAGVRLHLHRWDAARLPLAEQSIDCIVTNLPWGRQVHADEQLAAFYHQVCTELKRVLVPGGRLVLLTSLPALVQLGGMVRREAVEISLFGQNPSILKYTA
jgi:tRNA (guanine6-N2)-methyltransferase